MKCPRCGAELVRRNGRFGEFYGCSNFPDCRYTQDTLHENNYEYGNETYDYIESQTLRRWNPSMKKWGRDKRRY